MSAILEDIKTDTSCDTYNHTKKQICVTCGHSEVARHESGMINMICKLSREGVNSFSFCCCYMRIEGGVDIDVYKR